MNIFNFFKKNKTRNQIFENALRKNPALKRLAFEAELEYTLKEASNLRAVGRDADAVSHSKEYLRKCMIVYTEDIHNTEHINYFTTASFKLNMLPMCVKMLESLVETNKKHHVIDLTMVYFNLGKVYHQIHMTCDEELKAFHMGAEAQAPPKCRFPATIKQKARCHFFARSCANVLDREDYAELHYNRLLSIDHNVDWNDPFVAMDWLNSK